MGKFENKVEERRQKAREITERSALYAAGAGLIPFPIIDAVALSRIQIVMIQDICKVYGVDFGDHRLRSRVTALVGDVAAIGLFKMIPGLGVLFAGATTAVAGAASTYALGVVFTDHFEQGGGLLDFDPVRFRDAFQQEFEKGKKVVADLKKQVRSEKEMEDAARQPGSYEELLEQNKALLESLRALREELAAFRRQNEDPK